MLLLFLGAAVASPQWYSPPTFPAEVSTADPVTGPQIRVDSGETLLTVRPLLYSDIVVEAYAGIARVTLLQDFAASATAGATPAPPMP